MTTESPGSCVPNDRPPLTAPCHCSCTQDAQGSGAPEPRSPWHLAHTHRLWSQPLRGSAGLAVIPGGSGLTATSFPRECRDRPLGQLSRLEAAALLQVLVLPAGEPWGPGATGSPQLGTTQRLPGTYACVTPGLWKNWLLEVALGGFWKVLRVSAEPSSGGLRTTQLAQGTCPRPQR